MSAPADPGSPSPPGTGPPHPRPATSARPWARALGAGAALVLAGAPVGAVVQGDAWWACAGGVVALVVLVGIAAQPLRGAGVAAAQLVVLAVAVTARFATSGVLRVVPGPGAVGELAARLDEAGAQIRTGTAPVPATPAMLLLVTLAFGLTAVAVHAVAVGARAPAAAGVLLLAVFAVPTALAEELLPAWMLAAAAAGFGLLLLSGGGRGWLRGAPAGAAVTGAALVLALGIGAAADGIGTAGRAEGGGVAVRGGEIGLSPFAALRGQLQQRTPSDLFQVTGLPRPAYLRALTLSGYVPNSGWQPRRPGAGRPLTTGLPAVDVPGDRVTVTVENLGFRDYWLPLFGEPSAITGVPAERWAYDALSGTMFSTRPRRDDTWTEAAVLPAPSAATLRAATGTGGVDPAFLDTGGIDPRVAAIAAQVTAGAPTAFDRALALNTWFTGPDSAFHYDLTTAPGNGDDAMVDFLTHGRRGYCEQFASSMAAMLRTVGVPSRVAVGFTGGRESGDGRAVGTADAHAWVEAWFPGAGWTTFDPTPLSDGRGIVPPYVAEATGKDTSPPEAAPPSAAPDPATAGPEPTPTPSAAPTAAAAAPDAATPPVPVLSPALVSVLLRVLGYLAAAAAVVALVAAPAVVRARQRRGRLAAAAAGGPDAAGAAWEELLAESTDRGSPRVATDTVRGAARRMVDDHGLDRRAQEALRDVVGIVEASWYGAVDAEPGALTGPARAVHGAIASTPLGVRGRLLPRSLTDRVRRARPARPGRPDGSDDGPVPTFDDDAEHDDAAAIRR